MMNWALGLRAAAVSAVFAAVLAMPGSALAQTAVAAPADPSATSGSADAGVAATADPKAEVKTTVGGKGKGGPAASLTALVPAAAQGSRFAGSLVSYRNSTSVISLNKAAEPTYNPFYAMSLTLAPNVNLGKKLFVRGNISLSRELTNADWTNTDGEVTLSDTTFTFGIRAFQWPKLGIMWNFDLQSALPTSLASQARTLTATSALGSQIIFFKGHFFAVGSFRATKFWNRSTTSETETPWLRNCRDITGGCDPYVNTGFRNAEFRITTVASAGYTFLPWLTMNVTGGVVSDLLYENSTQQARGGYPIAPRADAPNYREFMYYALSADFRVRNGVTLSLGTEAFNAQLAPDSTYQRPFFNRNSTLFFDVTVFPDRLLP